MQFLVISRLTNSQNFLAFNNGGGLYLTQIQSLHFGPSLKYVSPSLDPTSRASIQPLPYHGCQSLRESKDEEREKGNAKENGRGKGRDGL